MREGARANVASSTLLGLGALLVLSTLLAFDCGPPPPPPPTANEVKTIEQLVACMDGALAGQNVTVADAVQCIPPKCSLTLTMSPKSAQAACIKEGGDMGRKCQLPRVLLDCPGPPRLQPSFLLCPTGSGEGDHQGSNRIEVGQDVDDLGNMRMADIVVKPGLYEAPTDFMSKKTADSDGGTKQCNQACRNVAGTPAVGEDERSQPIDPSGSFGSTQLAPCIISTDACDRKATPGVCDGTQVTAQCLSDICDCIDQALTDVEGGREPAHRQLDSGGTCVAEALPGPRAVPAADRRLRQRGVPAAVGARVRRPRRALQPHQRPGPAASTGYSCQPTEADVSE